MARSSPHDSVLGTIGDTPMVRVHASPPEVPVYAKLESFNPGGSVKDRIGKYIIERLVERGDLPPGGTVVEPTAGNTGIGMALAARQLDLEAIFVVPEGFSEEKEQLMAALGASVVHTPHDEGMDGAIRKAEAIVADRDDAVVPQQFSNPLNVEAHYETTGPEIFEALDGEVGAVVAGMGTGGTLMGIAKYAREQDASVHVAAVEPEGSEFAELLGESPESAEYRIEGIGTHQPEIADLVDPSLLDAIHQIPDREAHAEVQRLGRDEGHLVGSSAAAASVAARRVAESIADGTIDAPHDDVVTVFPDSSERYLSKGIYGSFDEWASDD